MGQNVHWNQTLQKNALLANARFNCTSSCADISALTLSGNMIWPKWEARLFELSPSPSLVEAIVKEYLMNKKDPEDRTGSGIQTSKNGDLKLETKLFKYSQIWAAN